MQLEYQLRTEVEFWRDAIETRQPEVTEETLERMILARSVAERKLELLLENGGPAVN